MSDEELDLSKCVSLPHPIAKVMGCKITIGLAHADIDYFKAIGDKIGLSAEQVMQIYLRNIIYTGYKIPIDIPPQQSDEASVALGNTL